MTAHYWPAPMDLHLYRFFIEHPNTGPHDCAVFDRILPGTCPDGSAKWAPTVDQMLRAGWLRHDNATGDQRKHWITPLGSAAMTIWVLAAAGRIPHPDQLDLDPRTDRTRKPE